MMDPRWPEENFIELAHLMGMTKTQMTRKGTAYKIKEDEKALKRVMEKN